MGEGVLVLSVQSSSDVAHGSISPSTIQCSTYSNCILPIFSQLPARYPGSVRDCIRLFHRSPLHCLTMVSSGKHSKPDSKTTVLYRDSTQFALCIVRIKPWRFINEQMFAASMLLDRKKQQHVRYWWLPFVKTCWTVIWMTGCSRNPSWSLSYFINNKARFVRGLQYGMAIWLSKKKDWLISRVAYSKDVILLKLLVNLKDSIRSPTQRPLHYHHGKNQR